MLTFNIAKCKAVIYGNIKYEYTYEMTDTSGNVKDLPTEDEEKDLGILFHSSLQFNKHVSTIVSKANRILYLIKRSFSFMDKSLFLKLYKTLVCPHLGYGNSVWFPSTKKNKQLIENVQRRATKLVPEIKDLRDEDRLEALNLPTLEYRRKRGDLI